VWGNPGASSRDYALSGSQTFCRPQQLVAKHDAHGRHEMLAGLCRPAVKMCQLQSDAATVHDRAEALTMAKDAMACICKCMPLLESSITCHVWHSSIPVSAILLGELKCVPTPALIMFHRSMASMTSVCASTGRSMYGATAQTYLTTSAYQPSLTTRSSASMGAYHPQ
jgi:hypothetical protein